MIKGTDYNEFLTRYCHDEVIELVGEYPERLTFVVDFQRLEQYDNDAGERLLNTPDSELKNILQALKEYDHPGDPLDRVIISIKNMPASETAPIYKIGAEHVNKLIAVKCRISKQGPKKNKLLEGAFKCQRCDHTTVLYQPDDKYIEPFECDNDVCGRKGPFKLIHEESVFVDEQKLELQDLNETLKPGQPVRDVIAVLRGKDLITNIPAVGAQVVVTGIVRTVYKKDSSLFDVHLEVLHIEPTEAEIDVSVSAADKKEFKNLSLHPDIFDTLISSTAPEILGYSEIKLALLCSIVSGSKRANGELREYVHVVIVGDPGTGKSALLKSVRALVPKAQYSAGRGSSVAGLTVAVIKDELSGSGYTAQAGALVLADNGLMVLDEADKLEPGDLQALNTALEESFIEIHKGGLNQKFNTRCPVIAILNPKYIRFDGYKPLIEQIPIPPDTLSRFDLVFKILDIPEQTKDRAVAEHQAKNWKRIESGSQGEEVGVVAVADNSEVLPLEKLRKYVSHAKSFEPKTNDLVRAAIIDHYLTLRKIDETGTIAATARDNNALYRLTKAIAKLRLSNDCSIEDVKRAISIYQASQEAFRDPTTGKLDSDLLYGMGKNQRYKIKTIIEVIRELQSSNGKSAFFDDIVSSAKAMGISREATTDILKQLKTRGDVIEMTDGMYQVII